MIKKNPKKKKKSKQLTKPYTEVEKIKHIKYKQKFNQLVNTNNYGVYSNFQLKFIPQNSNYYYNYYGIYNFSPPINWIEPIKRWDLIWSYIDQREKGYKRDYHYTLPGQTDENGVTGPAIYFYDKDSNDLNFSFNWKYDFIYTELEHGCNGEYTDTFNGINLEKAIYKSCKPIIDSPPNFERNPYGGYYYDEYCVILTVTNSCKLNIAANDFIMYPSENTMEYYYSCWLCSNQEYRYRILPPLPHI